MRLTKRGEYALRAMIDLGLAQASGSPLVQIGYLAEKENIPEKFLEAILVELKKLGYLESKRGKNGGYLLRKPMKQIRIGDLIRNIEGPLAPIGCVSKVFYEKCSCPDEEHCGLHMLMQNVRDAISNILDQYTLEDAVDAALKKIRKDRVAFPFVFDSVR